MSRTGVIDAIHTFIPALERAGFSAKENKLEETLNLANLLNAFLGLLSPFKCPLCGAILKESEFAVCPGCLSSMAAEARPSCKRAKKISKALSCYRYGGKTKECIKLFKFRGRKSMAAVFAEIVKKRNVLSFFETEKIDLIIPVPISRHALTKRGYNQSRLLADELSFLLKAPVAENIILKSWKAARQTGLAQQERIKNAKRAILCRKNISLAGRTILLVDDVATTGSTLEACAEKLIERGARRILAFVLARTSE